MVEPASRPIAEPGRRRPAIGVLLDWLEDDYQHAVFAGARAALEHHGADVICVPGGAIGATGPNNRASNRAYDLVSGDRFDGLILLSGSLSNYVGPERLRAYCRRFEPLPMCSIAIELASVPSVVVDNTTGFRAIIAHLIEVHGCRRIAFIRGPDMNEEAERRFAIYRELLEAHAIAFDPALVAPGDFGKPSGEKAVALLCDERRVRIDAIVGANDYMALGAQDALQQRNIRVPQQIAVVGFDDVEEARFASPPLTTVRQPLFEQGEEAVRVVLARCRGEEVPPKTVLATSVVLRQSCGCFAASLDGARFGRSAPSGASLSAFLDRERAHLRDRLLDSVPAADRAIDPGWPEELFDAFAGELAGRSRDVFVPAFEDVLRRAVASGANARAWQATVTALRAICLPELETGSPEWMAAEDLFQQARVLIGDIAERAQVQHRIALERWIRTLRETGQALATTFDVRALMHAVSEQLPRLAVPACAVSVYDDCDASGATSRLILAYDAERELELPPEGIRFRSRALAPVGYLPDRRLTLVVVPLYVKEEVLGFAAFEMGKAERRVFEGLREQISGALKGAQLVTQVVEEVTRRQRAERERLVKEMEIAERIQTTILPRSLNVSGLSIAAIMAPATEVGGDYYDVIAVDGGAWIGIGDVAGHGLQTGLVMLMIQSVVAGLVRQRPSAPPREIVSVLNAVIYDNVRNRLRQNEHATLSILRYERSGRIALAGAHEDLLVYRAASGRCETLATPGPWIGAVPKLGGLADSEYKLDDGDVLLLYTDGITEAKGQTPRDRFGLDRLATELERVGRLEVEAIRDHLIARVREFMTEQEDDMTLVVLRHRDP